MDNLLRGIESSDSNIPPAGQGLITHNGHVNTTTSNSPLLLPCSLPRWKLAILTSHNVPWLAEEAAGPTGWWPQVLPPEACQSSFVITYSLFSFRTPHLHRHLHMHLVLDARPGSSPGGRASRQVDTWEISAASSATHQLVQHSSLRGRLLPPANGTTRKIELLFLIAF